MEKKLRMSSLGLLILGFISVGWMMYNVVAFGYIRQKSPLSELLGMYVAIGLLVSFLFHLVAFVTIFLHFQYFKKITPFRVVTLVIGIISFISLIGDWAALHDIGDCLRTGASCAPEWTFLYMALIPHGLFQILVVSLILMTFRRFHNVSQPDVIIKDETMSDIIHVVGACCGFVGIGFTILTFLLQVKAHILKLIVVPYCVFILFPYGLIVFYWLVMKRKEKRVDWYDEKQRQDLNKAGLITVIVSIPLMTIMFLLSYGNIAGPGTMMWFPYYLFIILLVFSGTTLYYGRR